MKLQKMNRLKYQLISITVIEIKNEYDTDNIIEVIKGHNPMMIRGVYPGTGKSFICQKMVDKGYKD